MNTGSIMQNQMSALIEASELEREDYEKKIEEMIIYLINRKHKMSGGHNGLSAPQFNKIFHSFLEKLSTENKLTKRPTIHGETYFLNQLYYANRNQKSED